MAAGASLTAPDTVFFSWDTALGRDVTVEPNVVFGPGVTVADKAVIRGFSHITGGDDRQRRRSRPLRAAFAGSGARRRLEGRQFR